jgi:hypothetical protein
MDDSKDSKLFNLFMVIGIIILAFNVYFFTHGLFASFGLSHAVLDNQIIKLEQRNAFFSHPLKTLIPALLCQLLYILGSKPKKEVNANMQKGLILAGVGLIIYGCSFITLKLFGSIMINGFLYIAMVLSGFYIITKGFNQCWQCIRSGFMHDRFNDDNETFMQEDKLIENEYSINIATKFDYKKKIRKGWINVVNPFRGTLVIGNPGSGKSYAVIEEYLQQTTQKGYAACIYDYKFPDQTNIQYNNFIKHASQYKITPKFYVVNFDDPQYSHRCNPLSPTLIQNQSDAVNAAKTLLLNLNKSWIQKKGDFFVESPIALVSAIIWYLRIAHEGKYCTLPHLIMFLSKSDDTIFKIMAKYEELKPMLTPFMDALEKGAVEQLAGQTASARIPLSQIASKELFWIFSGDDFSLDINNADAPKIVCVGNNPKREIAYSAPLGLFFTQLVKEINQKNRLQSFLCMDEFPSLYTQGIDQLIATGRSNKVCVLLGIQDFSQIIRDYGKEVADVIINICGNIFCGQVVRDTAKAVQDMFGKILQQRESIALARQESTVTLNTQMEFIVPESKIANFSQGQFAAKVADNFDQILQLKISNAFIDIDPQTRTHTDLHKIPVVTSFPKDADGNSLMNKILDDNFKKIGRDIDNLVSEELFSMLEFV